MCPSSLRRWKRSAVDTVESGKMTKDLAAAIQGTTSPSEGSFLTTEQFMAAMGA